MGNVCKQEFKMSNYRLEHDSRQKFVEPEWGGVSVVYLVYRVLVALYFLANTLYVLINSFVNPYYLNWFVYLTNWSITMVTLDVLYESIIVIIHYKNKSGKASEVEGYNNGDVERSSPAHGMPVSYKVAWVIYNVASTAAILVSLMYWGALHDFNDPVLYPNLYVHALNSVYVLVNMFITAMPMRLLHFPHLVVYGLVYSIFYVIYWAATGNAIYSIIDYTQNPGAAAGICLGLSFLGTILVHAGLWSLHRLRMWLYGKCRSEQAVHPTEKASGVVNPAYKNETDDVSSDAITHM